MSPALAITDVLPDRTDTTQKPLQSEAPSNHEIAALAHQLWIERGCPEGSPEEDWLLAEEKLLRHRQANA
jgi:hypothetical protein